MTKSISEEGITPYQGNPEWNFPVLLLLTAQLSSGFIASVMNGLQISKVELNFTMVCIITHLMSRYGKRCFERDIFSTSVNKCYFSIFKGVNECSGMKIRFLN